MKIHIYISLIALVTIGRVAVADDSLDNLVDPTRPAYASTADSGYRSGPVLESTVVSPGRKLALISGRTLGIGAAVGNATIAEILPYEVILKGTGKSAGQETRLRLLPKLMKEEKLEVTPHAPRP